MHLDTLFVTIATSEGELWCKTVLMAAILNFLINDQRHNFIISSSELPDLKNVNLDTKFIPVAKSEGEI